VHILCLSSNPGIWPCLAENQLPWFPGNISKVSSFVHYYPS
jgi:hypothetical protein